MPGDGRDVSRTAVPARWSPAPDGAVERSPDRAVKQVVRDRKHWRVGAAADVAWIADGTTVDTTITSAIPAVFEAYATVVLPEDRAIQEVHDEAVLSVLGAHSMDRQWWLGYLNTGADDVVFPDAPRVSLYSDWPLCAGSGRARAGREMATIRSRLIRGQVTCRT